ncbi:MAG: hypothetical protein H6531_09125 [Actinobacteria bacterium]|nr:hypothetical protein [Actinomycetota bacterium]
MFRPPRVLSLLALACLASVIVATDESGAVPTRAGEGASTARELAVRRDPARLWYRFQVTFNGTSRVTYNTPRGEVTLKQTRVIQSRYTMVSRAATIVTRRCVVRARGREVFSVARSCRDARKIPRVRRNRGWLRLMREEFGFNANLTGRIFGGTERKTSAPADARKNPYNGVFEPCPSSSAEATDQAIQQRALGYLQTVGGTSGGVDIRVTPDVRHPSGAHITIEPVTCPTWRKEVDGQVIFIDPPEMFTTPGSQVIKDDWVWRAMDELGTLGGKPLSARRRFNIRPGQYGKVITKRWHVSGRARAQGDNETRDYAYMLRMIPCPNGGRRVKGC